MILSRLNPYTVQNAIYKYKNWVTKVTKAFKRTSVTFVTCHSNKNIFFCAGFYFKREKQGGYGVRPYVPIHTHTQV